MNTKKLAFAAAVAACFALLAACGGSASKDAAGTLMEAKPAAATEAPAAGAGANVAAEGDATVKSGEAANGAAASKPGWSLTTTVWPAYRLISVAHIAAPCISGATAKYTSGGPDCTSGARSSGAATGGRRK